MRALILFILCAFTTSAWCASPSLVEVRELYKKATQDEASCEKLIELLRPYTENNNTLLAGYKACATIVMAKHVFNPATKMSRFSEGRQLLEKCIAADKNNIELRFLRFAVQTKSPSFLNYKSAVKEDKQIILTLLNHVTDIHLRQIIISFMKDSDELTPEEKKRITSKS
ncbi:MAG: hypothetical protein V4658_02700 [Bacteroidota bacterium]